MSLRSLIAKGFHSLRERKSCVDETKRLRDLVTGCSDSERENHVWRFGSRKFSPERSCTKSGPISHHKFPGY